MYSYILYIVYTCNMNIHHNAASMAILFLIVLCLNNARIFTDLDSFWGTVRENPAGMVRPLVLAMSTIACLASTSLPLTSSHLGDSGTYLEMR